jgi:putative colanic acid biosynthesis acetyltransferase WcaF
MPARAPLLQIHISRANWLLRALWECVWLLLFRPSPTPLFGWRRLLLRLFGARLGRRVRVYGSVKIWAPWNLRMADHSCLSPFVICYSVAQISLGRHANVSQYSYLCSASHDYRQLSMPTIAAPITLEEEAWVAADVFVGPGVTIGRGAVVGARSTVTGDVAPWSVVAGSPPRLLAVRAPFERGSDSHA